MFHRPLTLSLQLPPATLREQRLSVRVVIAGIFCGFAFMLLLAALAGAQPARSTVSSPASPRHAAHSSSFSKP
ncbi:hypothetical protein [Oleiharenicola lentus]|uniref:hypothetical protein n=1 Tax=Oleiharenicola lentus TaxID=2508720 RepID=UPI003F668E43